MTSAVPCLDQERFHDDTSSGSPFWSHRSTRVDAGAASRSGSAAEPARSLIDPADGYARSRLGMAGEPLPLVRGGEHGLWRVQFEDGSSLDARAASGGGAAGASRSVTRPARTGRSWIFRSPDVASSCRSKAETRAWSSVPRSNPGKGPVLAIDLPARLRFDPSTRSPGLALDSP